MHVTHDPAGARRHPGLRQHLPVHGHQPEEILPSRQQVDLEPMPGSRSLPPSVPALRRPDETKGRVRRHAHRIGEVFVAREPTVDRLPQEIQQAELRVSTPVGNRSIARRPDVSAKPRTFIRLVVSE